MRRIETLKRRVEFQRVRTGRRWAMPAFVLQAKAREQASADDWLQARFGFTVSDRALREQQEGKQPSRAGAVKRNRARRRLREAVRLLAPVHARAGFDYVIIGRRDALHQNFADLLEDMRVAFAKVHGSGYGRRDAPHDGAKG